MTPLGLALVACSVVLHVAWNALGRQQRPSAAFMLLANTLGTLVLLPGLIAQLPRLPDVPDAVWVAVVATGLCQALYLAGLAAAYRTGEFSVAYPIARSVPPILVLIAAVVLGRADRIEPIAMWGIGAVVAGGLLLPLARLSEAPWLHYAKASTVFALLAAAGTTGYSLLDDHALRLLRERGPDPFDPASATLLYAPLEALASSLWLGAWVFARRKERAALRSLVRAGVRPALVTGTGMYLSYGLALAAMSYARDVSYVVAFRQLGIPLSALVGVIFLAEPRTLPKLLGVALVFAGAVLVAAG